MRQHGHELEHGVSPPRLRMTNEFCFNMFKLNNTPLNFSYMFRGRCLLYLACLPFYNISFSCSCIHTNAKCC